MTVPKNTPSDEPLPPFGRSTLWLYKPAFFPQICTEKKTILSVDDILALIGDRCDGVIGQLTEDWGETLFSALSRAGGKAFSNMAVGYNNVDVEAANKYGVAVGNTPDLFVLDATGVIL
ncbi:hypothetical protein FXO37_05391 [Capsicum annuum]|nr:hypothetical protein FXO37_05391 [Capsicum annuum]